MPTGASNVTSIQDVLFLENRDRKYSDTVFELRTIYSIGDSDFDLKQFGLFLTNDTYFLEFALNRMVEILGRKILPGDVIELPHQRDDQQLNDNIVSNKFYVVEDVNRASDGYSATWWPHIHRCKVSPMPASQEYNDILGQTATNPLGLPMLDNNGSTQTLGSLMSTMGVDLGLNEAVIASARANFTKRYFETQQYYYKPGTTSETGSANPWVYCGDAIPPNGYEPVGQGSSFPTPASQGDYYLRTDYVPAVLYMYDSSKWKRQESNYRGTWQMAHRLLESFINNDATEVQEDGEVTPQKVNISKVIKRPGVDF